jgi:hypothetical protein
MNPVSDAPCDARKFLDVQVEQFPRTLALVATRRRRRVEISETMESSAS